MSEDDLEQVIADLLARRKAAPAGSAERKFLERQLQAIRYSREGAGEIIEALDPLTWGGVPVTPLPSRPRQEDPEQ
jgi:hypothetical protein